MTDQEYGELRKEYTKYRDIFQKRVKRALKKGYKQAEPYRPPDPSKGIKPGYAYQWKLSELKDLPYLKQNDMEVFKRDLQMRVKELKRLVSEGVTSIAAVKKAVSERDKAIVKALKNSGYEHITISVLGKFGDFMDEMRKLYGKKFLPSDEAVEFFDSLKYNVKRKSTSTIVELWEEYKRNGYSIPEGSEDLFAT